MFISPPTFVGLEECAVLLSAVAQVYDLAATGGGGNAHARRGLQAAAGAGLKEGPLLCTEEVAKLWGCPPCYGAFGLPFVALLFEFKRQKGRRRKKLPFSVRFLP